MASIKLARACRVARMLPMAEREILASIPEDLVVRLTSRELAMVIKSLDVHWHKARAFESREILAEGCIWDNGTQKLREIGD